MFDQMILKNASIMDAYKAMHSKVDKPLSEEKVDEKDVEKAEDELEDVVAKIDEGIEHDDAEFGSWMDSVKSKHAGKNLKFKNRIEAGNHTTSAEVPGEDRSYGVWDHSERKGHVFESVQCNEGYVAKGTVHTNNEQSGPVNWSVSYSDFPDLEEIKKQNPHLSATQYLAVHDHINDHSDDDLEGTESEQRNENSHKSQNIGVGAYPVNLPVSNSNKVKVLSNSSAIQEAKEVKTHSVWSHDGTKWSHFSDSDNAEDAKDDREYLKNQGEKKVKILKTPMAMSDWRKPEHREAALKMLNEACSDDIEDADDSSIKKVEEGVDRSEASANRDLQLSAGNTGKARSKGKFYLMKGTEQVHPDAHDNVDSALKAWKTLDSTSGVKIVKEDVDGPVDVVSEELMESFMNVLFEAKALTDEQHSSVLQYLKDGKMSTHSEADIAKHLGTSDTNAVLNSLKSHAKDGKVSKYRGAWQYNHDEKPVHQTKEMVEESIDPNFVGQFNGIVTNHRMAGRQYDTVAFSTVKDANNFMASDAGKNHGFIGQCANGMYHCSDMNHEGHEISE